MAEITVPVLNSTDESYVLLEWLVPDGACVCAGDRLALIETSKAVTELVAEESGRLSRRLPEMSDCRPTEVIAHVSPDGADAPSPATAAGRDVTTGPGVTVTRPARELMEAHGVPLAAVERLGKPLIRRSDVEALIATGPPETTAGQADTAAPADTTGPADTTKPTQTAGPAQTAGPMQTAGPAEARRAAGTAGRAETGRPAGAGSQPRDVPAHQLAVARAVTRSHASIPAAFTVIKVPADSLLREQEAISKQTACFIGVPEFVIKAVALTAPAFPACLASVTGDLRLTPAGPADIGVTIDVGTGLYVPVIRAADALDLTAIARRMMYLRARAMRGRLSEDDLAGARITLTLHQAAGIVLAQPIIYPGQTCALSLAAPSTELRLDASGQVTESVYVHLGLSYDHRAINGREAAEFLGAIRDRLQAPGTSLSG